jgi:ATP-binding cassette subfamily B protein
MLASGGAELLSLGAIIPFLSVLSSPDQLWQQPLIHTLSEKFGLTVEADLLMPITVIFAVTVGVSAAVRVINLWLNGRLAAEIGSDLSGDAYLRILYQPYSVHIQRNSSTVIKTLTLHVGRTVAALNSTLLIATSVVVALFLLTGLLLIDWIVALVIGIFIASA